MLSLSSHRLHQLSQQQPQPQNYPQQFLILLDLNCHLHLHQAQQPGPAQPQQHNNNNSLRSEEELQGTQNPKIQQRLQQYFRKLKTNTFQPIRTRSMQIIRKLAQKKSAESRSNSSRVVSMGSSGIFSRQIGPLTVLKVMMLMFLFHSVGFTVEERRSIIESRWIIGPRQGSELKDWLYAKEFKQVISRDDKYASTPQSTTLKLILLISIHQW